MKFPFKLIAKIPKPASLVTSLIDLVDEYAEMKKHQELERTKRVEYHEQIKSYIKKIESEREVFERYFAKEMEQRNLLYSKLFSLLDDFERENDADMVEWCVEHIVAVASEAPIQKYNRKITGGK